MYQRYTDESLSPDDSIYLHKPGRHEHSHYFKLVVVDTANNKRSSFPVYVNIPDTIPPPKPKGLLAKIDTTGTVHIEWNEEYIEANDLLGFRVYFSNSPKREFSQLTVKPEISHFYSYNIPLNTLTEKIYYKVQAVDNSYNHSEFSDIIEAQKPDTIPPVTPVLKQPEVTQSYVKLSWNLSPSSDVIKQLITRYRLDIDEIKIYEIDKAQTNYTDTTAQKGVVYEYTIVSVDDSRHQSEESFPVRARVIDKKHADGIDNLSATYNRADNSIELAWSYPLAGDYRFQIYRSVDNENIKRYKSLEPRFTSYEDRVSAPGTYYYAIKVVYNGGAMSLLSEPVSVDVQ